MKNGIERLRENCAGSAKLQAGCVADSNPVCSNELLGRRSDVD